MVCLKSLLLGALALASVGSATMQKETRRAVTLRRADANAAAGAGVAKRSSYGHQHRRRSFELITGVEAVTTYVAEVATQVNAELEADVPAVATVESLLGGVVTKVSSC